MLWKWGQEQRMWSLDLLSCNSGWEDWERENITTTQMWKIHKKQKKSDLLCGYGPSSWAFLLEIIITKCHTAFMSPTQLWEKKKTNKKNVQTFTSLYGGQWANIGQTSSFRQMASHLPTRILWYAEEFVFDSVTEKQAQIISPPPPCLTVKGLSDAWC